MTGSHVEVKEDEVFSCGTNQLNNDDDHEIPLQSTSGECNTSARVLTRDECTVNMENRQSTSSDGNSDELVCSDVEPGCSGSFNVCSDPYSDDTSSDGGEDEEDDFMFDYCGEYQRESIPHLAYSLDCDDSLEREGSLDCDNMLSIKELLEHGLSMEHINESNKPESNSMVDSLDFEHSLDSAASSNIDDLLDHDMVGDPIELLSDDNMKDNILKGECEQNSHPDVPKTSKTSCIIQINSQIISNTSISISPEETIQNNPCQDNPSSDSPETPLTNYTNQYTRIEPNHSSSSISNEIDSTKMPHILSTSHPLESTGKENTFPGKPTLQMTSPASNIDVDVNTITSTTSPLPQSSDQSIVYTHTVGSIIDAVRDGAITVGHIQQRQNPSFYREDMSSDIHKEELGDGELLLKQVVCRQVLDGKEVVRSDKTCSVEQLADIANESYVRSRIRSSDLVTSKETAVSSIKEIALDDTNMGLEDTEHETEVNTENSSHSLLESNTSRNSSFVEQDSLDNG